MAGRNKNIPYFASGPLDPFFGAVDEGFLIPVWKPSGTWGAASPSQIGTSGAVLTPEMFGAKGNGTTDDMAAFQRAFNAIYALGGGTLELSAPEYYLGQFTKSQVGSRLLGQTMSGATSRCMFVPPNCTVKSVANTRLLVLGGNSSPLGFSFSVSILASPPVAETGTPTAVVAVNQNARQVTVNSTAGMVVGQTVDLGRRGGNTGGVPNTPSQERSPHQILTIKSIVGNVITFEEAFIHWFEAAQDLLLWFLSANTSYPTDIYLDGVRIAAAPASAQAPYVLFSRVLRSGYDRVVFEKNTSFSFGTCQDIRIGQLEIYVEGNNGSTIESTSVVDIDQVVCYGDQSTNSLGPLFFSDNCRNCHISSYTAYDFTQTGLFLAYGTDCVIDQLNLHGCGGAAVATTSFAGALSIGFPAVGAHPTLPVARAPGYLLRNNGPSAVEIKRLNITGAPTVPVRFHDAAVSIDDAYVEALDNNPVFLGGASGLNRADPTYFPRGGISSLRLGLVRAKSPLGQCIPIQANNGFAGPFCDYPAVLTAPVLAGSANLVVDKPEYFRNGDPVYVIDEAAAGTAPIARTLLSKAGNTLTLSAAVGAALSTGQGVWTYPQVPSLTSRTMVERFEVNNQRVGSFNGEIQIYPSLTAGAVTVALSLPGVGEWDLEIMALSPDRAHAAGAFYRVVYSNANNTFPLNGIFQINKDDIKIRAFVAITAYSAAAGVVSITFTCSQPDYIWLRYAWRRVRQVSLVSGINQ